MKQKPRMERFGEFMEGKGFYIVLFLCVAAIGISGYFLFTGLVSSIVADQQSKNVSGSAQVEVVEPEAPEIPFHPAQTAEKPKTEDVWESEAGGSTASDAKAKYVWPVRGEVSRDFSLEVFGYDETMGDWRTHSGVDITAKAGTKVLAASDGTVASVENDPLMGMTVTIEHANGMKSTYANLDSNVAVKKGDKLTYSSVIGTVGTTAIAENSGASHLHFEMRENGVAVDPIQYLK